MEFDVGPDLETSPLEPAEEPAEPRRPRGPGIWPAAAVIGVVLLALLVYFLFFRSKPAPPPPPPVPATAASQDPAPSEAADEPEIELPALYTSDSLVRQWVAALSSHPRLLGWLASEELVRRFVVTVDNISQGVSPRTHLPMMTPAKGFQAARRGETVIADPQSFQRYRTVTDVFASLDVQGAADLYRRLEPLINEAYRDLGYPDRDFDETLSEAIDVLLRTPVPEGDIELVPKLSSYSYADPELEALSGAQKQFLRLGPENMRRIRGKLSQLAVALELRP